MLLKRRQIARTSSFTRTTKLKSWQFYGVADGTVSIIVVTHKIANKGKSTKMTMKHFVNELKNPITL